MTQPEIFMLTSWKLKEKRQKM